MTTLHRTASLLVAAVLAIATVASCGGDGTAEAAPEDGPAGAGSSFPLTVENCGRDLTFEEPPERVVLLGPYEITTLAAVSALDQVVARAGPVPLDLYDEDTRATVEAIPEFGGIAEEGGPEVSLEQVLDLDPDLVIGSQRVPGSGVTAEALDQAEIPLVSPPSFCLEPVDVPQTSSFEDIYTRLEFYGELLASDDDANVSAVELRERVDAVIDVTEDAPERTAATFFPSLGDSPTTGYGTRSISHQIMETAGFTNVFSDVDERFFDASIEAIIDRDPDVIVLLYIDTDPAEVKEAFLSIPGAETLTAVQNDDILLQNFELHGAPSPLSVEGLENFDEAFGTTP